MLVMRAASGGPMDLAVHPVGQAVAWSAAQIDSHPSGNAGRRINDHRMMTNRSIAAAVAIGFLKSAPTN